MRLLRDNTEDPRVMRDLEMLAGAYADDVAAVAVLDDPAVVDDATDDAAEEEPREPSPFDDGFVRTFVRTSVHIRRFFPYYLGAAVWAAVMLMMSPASDKSSDLASASRATANLAPAGDFATEAAADTPAPAFTDVGATPADAPFSTIAPSTSFSSDLAADDTPSTATTTEPATFDSSAFESSAPSSVAIEDEPEPLRITKSGYSSRTGGTPLEQAPPGNGLPVAAVGGEATKRSFIALSGDETTLRLKLVEDSSNVGADQAAVRACAVTAADWEAARGMAMDAEPSWGEPCVDGARGDDGVWAFDLSSFGDPGSVAGFALTPGTAAGLSFNVTFDPAPVRQG